MAAQTILPPFPGDPRLRDRVLKAIERGAQFARGEFVVGADPADIMLDLYADIGITILPELLLAFNQGRQIVENEYAGLLDAVLENMGQRITAINDTTRQQVMEQIRDGLSEGEGMATIGDRIEDLTNHVFSEYRGELIARTETNQALNYTSITSYAAYGVNAVQAIDGDYDEVCAARNGQVFTLEEAANIEDHPNGTLDWNPIVGGERGTGPLPNAAYGIGGENEMARVPEGHGVDLATSNLPAGSPEWATQLATLGVQVGPPLTWTHTGTDAFATPAWGFVDPSLQPHVQAAFQQMHDLVPWMFDEKGVVLESGAAGAYAETSAVAPPSYSRPTIRLNSDIWTDPTELLKRLATDDATGWSVGTTPESVIIHEFGHAIDYQMGNYGYEYSALASKAFYKALGSDPLSGEVLPSRYAATNRAECFAEEFTRYVLGRATGTKLDDVMGQVLDALRNKQLGDKAP